MYSSQTTVKINNISELQTLISTLLQFDTDVDIYVKAGNYCVDGHSIMGMMSLDYSKYDAEITFTKDDDFTSAEVDNMFAIKYMHEEENN